MTADPGVPRDQVLLPAVRDLSGQLSPLQRIAAGLATIGGLFLFLGMAFNWYAIEVSVSGGGLSYSQYGGIGFGSLLGGDLERRYSGLGGLSAVTGSRPDIDSSADWYAAGYLMLTVVLVVLVFMSLLVRGGPQILLRIGAATAAVSSLILVILISADLADMANALEDHFRKTLGELGGILQIEYAVDPSIGPGLVLAAVANLVLGVAAGINQPRGAAATGPSLPPGGWPPPPPLLPHRPPSTQPYGPPEGQPQYPPAAPPSEGWQRPPPAPGAPQSEGRDQPRPPGG